MHELLDKITKIQSEAKKKAKEQGKKKVKKQWNKIMNKVNLVGQMLPKLPRSRLGMGKFGKGKFGGLNKEKKGLGALDGKLKQPKQDGS
jgi:hypothetical protein